MAENKRFKVVETITHDDRRVYELTKNDIGYYNFKGEKLLAHLICNELNILLEENEELKQQIGELEFKLRTIEAYDRTVKEEHSDTVYVFEKKLEKW